VGATPHERTLTVVTISRRTLPLCLFAAALLGTACNPPAGKKADKPSATACADYAKKVCDEAGAESPTCASVKTTTDLLPASACVAASADFAFTKNKLGEARKSCDELSTKLCAEIGAETETCTMVKTQTKQFPPERCKMMMEHIPEVVADLKKREAKNQPLPPEKVAAIAKSDAPSFGPESSPVTIVEFSDFQCPFCSRAATATSQLKKTYGDKVRFVFRQFPLSFHQNANLAAQASLAANAQGKFWEFHDKLFADQSKLERPALEATAKSIGLDMTAFKKALDDKTYEAAVAADMKLGEEVAVDGTPTMFLNGKRVQDPTNFEEISKQIDAALGKKG
jgi:protein-disulfide isomerase